MAERVPRSWWVHGVTLGCPQNLWVRVALPGSSPHAVPPLPGLWNLVFLFSNMSLVFLMPFAYFFTESEGFAGSKKVGDPANPCPKHVPPVPSSVAPC